MTHNMQPQTTPNKSATFDGQETKRPWEQYVIFSFLSGYFLNEFLVVSLIRNWYHNHPFGTKFGLQKLSYNLYGDISWSTHIVVYLLTTAVIFFIITGILKSFRIRTNFSYSRKGLAVINITLGTLTLLSILLAVALKDVR